MTFAHLSTNLLIPLVLLFLFGQSSAIVELVERSSEPYLSCKILLILLTNFICQ